MKYLLIDTHHRFLGTLDSQKSLAVGDVFQNSNAQFYTVIALNWAGQGMPRTRSLTVIPVQKQSRSSKVDEKLSPA